MDAEFWKHWEKDLTRIKEQSDRHLAELDAMTLYREAGEAQAEGVYGGTCVQRVSPVGNEAASHRAPASPSEPSNKPCPP